MIDVVKPAVTDKIEFQDREKIKQLLGSSDPFDEQKRLWAPGRRPRCRAIERCLGGNS